MASHLSSGKINLAILREAYRRELLDCLDKNPGPKAIIWDESLMGPIGLLTEYALLREHEVEKMFPLNSDGRLPPSNVKHVVFVTRPTVANMSKISQAIRREVSMPPLKKDYHIIFVPRRSIVCEDSLKTAGVYGTFSSVDEFNVDLIPLDNDVMSMEQDTAFKDLFVHNDPSCLFDAAKGLMTLQALYGIIPNIYAKGQHAKTLLDLMIRMRRELMGSESLIQPQIDNLVILDRSIDYVTPLLTQLTYEGLIDEIYNIVHTSVKVPGEKFQTSGGPNQAPSRAELNPEPKKIVLNSGEELFAELRDKNFNAVGPMLSHKAKLLSNQFDERHSAKTVGDLKQFVSKIPHMQAAKTSLAVHTSVAELIKAETDTDEFFETLRLQQEILQNSDPERPNPTLETWLFSGDKLPLDTLRLMCLQSCCSPSAGLKQRLLEAYRKAFIQTHGSSHLMTLANLEKSGLLGPENPAHNVARVKKSLKLVVDDVNEQNPTDPAYVFSGYCPVSVRLAQVVQRTGWRTLPEILGNLPGPSAEETQALPPGLRSRRLSGGSTSSSLTEHKTTLVFFVGGVTFAEISALRFLSQLDEGMSEYIIASTKIINGQTLLESVMEDCRPRSSNPF